VTSFAKMRADLVRLLPDTGALVTTMIDYYGLPMDTPGMANRPAARPMDRVRHVEESIGKDLGCPRHFLPFLALHEFEALLFTDPAITAEAIPAPEDINEHLDTAPSKRLQQVFPTYKKTLHGPTAAKRIGLSAIRSCCPHFDSWVTRLEQIAVG